MAISQKKYVEIGSQVTISAPGLPIRALFIIPNGTSIASGVTVGTDVPKQVTNADFITGTSAVKTAIQTYFSSRGSTGLSPSDALVIKAPSSGQNPYSLALQAAINSAEPFTCCCPLMGEASESDDTVNQIATAEVTAMFELNTDSSIQFFIPTNEEYSATTHAMLDLANGKRLLNMTFGGTGNDFQKAACAAMGIICATDYDQPNSAPTLMYKRHDSVSASVTDDAAYLGYVNKNVNFFGLTKTYGSSYTFYQRGVNGDGTDTAIEVNDLWLRGTISRGLMTLLTNMPKIPANATGVSSIYTVVDSAAQRGLDNGVILANKTLSAEKRALVLSYAGGDEEAVNDVQSQGYHISCQLVETGNEYECKYVLIYSKGDAIKKIVGTHVLI